MNQFLTAAEWPGRFFKLLGLRRAELKIRFTTADGKKIKFQFSHLEF